MQKKKEKGWGRLIGEAMLSITDTAISEGFGAVDTAIQSTTGRRDIHRMRDAYSDTKELHRMAQRGRRR